MVEEPWKRGLAGGVSKAISFKKYTWEFRPSLEGSSHHLFDIAETKLGPQVHDTNVQVEGYSIIHQDRKLAGGGIALYIYNSLKAKILHTSPTTLSGIPGKPEYLFCLVWEGNRSLLLVVVVYRPADVPLRSDRHFPQLLRTCSLDYSHKIIMIDWNADFLDVGQAGVRLMRGLENLLEGIAHLSCIAGRVAL